MSIASPLRPNFGNGPSAAGSFASMSDAANQFTAKLGTQAYQGRNDLLTYKQQAQDAIRAAGKSKSTQGSLPDFRPAGNAISEALGSFFSRGSNSAPQQSGSLGGDGSGAAFGARYGVDPVSFAFKQPVAFAGEKLSNTPFYWGGASQMNTAQIVQNSYRTPMNLFGS